MISSAPRLGNLSCAEQVSAIEASLRALLSPDPSALFEVRALKVRECNFYSGPLPYPVSEYRHTYSGSYHVSEIEQAARDAWSLDTGLQSHEPGHAYYATGIYLLANPIKPECAKRLHDFPRLGRIKGGEAYSDRPDKQEIAARRSFILDFDPTHAEGAKDNPASDDERRAAFDLWGEVRDYLVSRGWPLPALVCSGNGYQPSFRCESHSCEPDAPERDLVHRVLKALAARFNNGRVNIDVHVGNPARIQRLPGTMNRKGTATAERPHRRAELLDVGEDRLVTLAQLEREAASEPRVLVSFVAAPQQQSDCRGAATATTTRPAPAPHTGQTVVTPEVDAVARDICESAQPAVFGQNCTESGSRITMKVIRRLLTGLDLSFQDARAFVTRHFLPRCGGKQITDRELDKLITTTIRTPATMPLGCLLPGRRTLPPSVRVLGYDDLTPDELAALAATEPPCVTEACPLAARDDIRELLKPRCCPTPFFHQLKHDSGGLCGVVAFRCNKGNCTDCRDYRARELFDLTADWLIDLTATDAPGEHEALYAALVPTELRPDVVDAVAYRRGRYCWVNTTNPEGVQASLAGAEDAIPTLRKEEKGQHLPKVGIGPQALCLLTLRPGVEPPEGFAPVSTARGLWALGNALLALPERPESPKNEDVRFRLWTRSTSKERRWGEPPTNRPSEYKRGLRSAYAPSVADRSLKELGVSRDFNTKDRRIQGRPAGWHIPIASHSKVLELLLANQWAPGYQTPSKVVNLARRWFEVIPDLGEGGVAEEALVTLMRLHLWSGPPDDPTDIVNELLAAKSRDDELDYEASSAIASLREQHRNGELQPTGLLAELLA